MSATIDITEAAALTVLRGFLVSILPSGIEVIRGQQNQTAAPLGPNWCEITPMIRKRLATGVEAYSGTNGERFVVAPTEMTVQTDIYGPLAADNAQIVKSLWRDRNATEFFGTFSGAPLYASEVRQMTFINDQSQYEYRHSLDLTMQINPSITLVQQFFDAAVVGLISVDATYPPT